jgi:hypothetical protein
MSMTVDPTLHPNTPDHASGHKAIPIPLPVSTLESLKILDNCPSEYQ